MKLKIELQKVFDTGLAARVIEQPDYGLHDILFQDDNSILTVSTYHYLHFCERFFYIATRKQTNEIASYNFTNTKNRDKMHDFILEAVEHINKPEILTFERIKSECVPMKHLLVDTDGGKRLYLGFNRSGHLVTDFSTGVGDSSWQEDAVKNWTIEEYKQ